MKIQRPLRLYLWVQYVPLIAIITWSVTLITLLAYWKGTGSPIYPWLKPSESEGAAKAYLYTNMNPVYISDVGSTKLQPLFITGAVLTGVIYLISLIFETVTRFRVTYNNCVSLRVLQLFIVLFGLIGQLGIIMVAILSTKEYPDLHHIFLSVFILGILLQLFCQIIQYSILTNYFTKIVLQQTVKITFRNPFWLSLLFKVVFTCIAGILTILFKLVNFENYSINARFEWALAFFYNFLFVITWYDLRHLYHHVKEYNSQLNFQADVNSSAKDGKDVKDFDMTSRVYTTDGDACVKNVS